jgi:RNA polymerase sigma-70 factor (ECF subfamily)
MDQTSVSLLDRLRRPNERLDAWPRFVELYTPVIYSWARHVGLQEADAVDLVQDVFVLLVRKMPEFTYDQHRSFRAWLKTVTLNRWRETRRRAATVPPQAPEMFADVAEADDSDQFWEAEYRQHLVNRALRVMQADFEPATWKACWEVVVNGRPAAEVAAQLNLTPGAVYAARFRVLGRLREELAGMLE